MLTVDSPDFFKILNSVRKEISEAVLIRLYEEMYRDISISSSFDRKFVRNIVVEEFSRYENIGLLEGEDSKKTVISNFMFLLENTGWLSFKYDKIQMTTNTSFTANGKRFAQALYELNSKNISTRLRNVRSTFNSLKAYESGRDSYDLLDAMSFSEYVISDLMEWINEINDAKKQMHTKAMQSNRLAGEMYFDFLHKEFKSIAINLTEDSAVKYSPEVSKIINNILDDDKLLEDLNRELKNRFTYFEDIEYAVEDILEGIARRIENASSSKLPEIYTAISQLTRNSEMLLRQANAISSHRDPNISELANLIKNSDNKDEELNMFLTHLLVPKIELFDPERILIKEHKKRISPITIVNENIKISPEERRKKSLQKAFRVAFGFTPKDVAIFIDKMLALNEGETINIQMDIVNYKDLLMALNTPSVATKLKGYEVIHTDIVGNNDYYTSNNIIIKRRDNL